LQAALFVLKKVLVEEKLGGKNAIPPFGRKCIFAEIGATLFQKHCRAWLCYVFEKRFQVFS
jgi:hypothetical protein